MSDRESPSSPIGTRGFLSLHCPRSQIRGLGCPGVEGSPQLPTPPSDAPLALLRSGRPASAWTLAGAQRLSRRSRPGLLSARSTASSLGLDGDAEPPPRPDGARLRVTVGLTQASVCTAASRSLYEGASSHSLTSPGSGAARAAMGVLSFGPYDACEMARRRASLSLNPSTNTAESPRPAGSKPGRGGPDSGPGDPVSEGILAPKEPSAGGGQCELSFEASASAS